MGRQIVSVNGVDGKKCQKCGEFKPISDFWRMPENKHGYSVFCKECYRDAPVGMKRCRCCKEQKPESDFNKVLDERHPDGFRQKCKSCRNTVRRRRRGEVREKVNSRKMELWHQLTDDQKRESYQKRSHKVFVWKLSAKFGITLEQYEGMVSRQGNKCAICGVHASEASRSNPNKRLHIDHCHKTGRVRGLLCNACNVGLGSFRDSQEVMNKAISYLSSQREMTEG